MALGLLLAAPVLLAQTALAQTADPAAPPTTTTTIPPGFDPATAPVEALSAWDPRSCTAGGAEGL